ncbi:zinc finger BED domain-containing protein RICESLEEPER 3-like [Alosa alosa]|uniref:zinc finger BED domain-containing protein RICESLEEPER 3-like n=1 Tax=Alosa alosa TaxID=278164 RepID=UPI0020154B4F|nr:zinc finger BED domain-containing protein RICESLEEPER 3-like [Alosa alosa]
MENLERNVHAACSETTHLNMVKAMEECGVKSLGSFFLNKTAETDSGVKTTKSALLEAVNKRFETSFSEQLYYLATILDPRYKDRYFDADLKLVAKNKLEKEVDKMTASATTSARATVGPTPVAEEAEPEEGEPQEKRMRTPSEGHSFLDMFDEILEEKEQDEQATGPTSVQVHGYLSEPTIPRNVSPLQYWQSNMTRFPALAPVARKYLSAPCTSVDSLTPLLRSFKCCQ